MIGCRKLQDLLLNYIFNAVLIGVQFCISLKSTNFGLKCVVAKLKENLASLKEKFIKVDKILDCQEQDSKRNGLPVHRMDERNNEDTDQVIIC